MNKSDIRKAVKLLNEIHDLDPDIMSELVNHRVPCNEAIADHPTVQVSPLNEVGMLGIINGIFGTNSKGHGYIMACYSKPEEGHELIGFEYSESGNEYYDDDSRLSGG